MTEKQINESVKKGMELAFALVSARFADDDKITVDKKIYWKWVEEKLKESDQE